MKNALIACCAILAVIVAYLNLRPEYDRTNDPVLLGWGKHQVAGLVQPSAEQKAGSEAVLDLGDGVKLELVWVTGGQFVMGAENGEKHELPLHSVSVKGFWLGKYEVTQKQYAHVMGKNPSFFKAENLPVECVNWYDAKEFCMKASKLSGTLIRLPTEAELEYAIRQGSRYLFGPGDKEEDLARVAWYRENAQTNSNPVGTLEPNPYGAYDLHGNVWEWCEDLWHLSYDGAPADGSAWDYDGYTIQRCMRGGSWLNVPYVCRSGYRYKLFPYMEGPYYGMRVAVSP